MSISKIFEIIFGIMEVFSEQRASGRFSYIPLAEHLADFRSDIRTLFRTSWLDRKMGGCNTESPCITRVETTSDTLTGRGGLALFSRYLEKIGIFDLLEDRFGHVRRNSKGAGVRLLFRQTFCLLFDGTSVRMSHFDKLKRDRGYAAAIETDPSDMVSSHTAKRFFGKFGLWCVGPFRRILQRLFIWRLRIGNPGVIELYLDTMVMNNDDAEKRQGVQPTCKKVKGFHPLQIIWNGKIADGIFRGGKKNGNCGDTVVSMVSGIVHLIRTEYREDAAIILRCDSAFFDEKNFAAFDALNIGFIASGKMYRGVRDSVGSASESFWERYDNGHQLWDFLEFGFRCDKWKHFYRAVYTRPFYKDRQMLPDFERPDNVMLTNIGMNEKILEGCSREERERWSDLRTVIASYHRCGADELAHRAFKDFGSEQMPFENFGQNTAFCYCMLISFFLFETFKEDVLDGVLPATSYATTIRRRVIDIAAKIVRTGHQIILKVSPTVMETLGLQRIWEKCQSPPPIPT